MEKIKIVRVNFSIYSDGLREDMMDSREYDYFWDGEASVGDFAVVLVGTAWKVVKIKQILMRSSKATKWVAAVFNKNDVEERIRKNEERNDLLISMRQRLEQFKEMEKFREIANNDSNMRDLLKQYEEVSK